MISDLLEKVANVFFGILILIAGFALVVLVIENLQLIAMLLSFCACVLILCCLLAGLWQLGEFGYKKIKNKLLTKRYYVDGL